MYTDIWKRFKKYDMGDLDVDGIT